MTGLSTTRKLSYAAGGAAMNLSNLVISQWLFVLWASGGPSSHVSPALFGSLFMLGRVTDAITDPLIGYWSDNARYRRGRRIPFIALGLLPFAVVFFLLWVPPIEGRHWLNAVYIALVIQTYFVLYTIVNTPYVSLLPEIAVEARDRINISTLQAVFVMLGTIVFGAMSLVLASGGWRAVGVVVAVVIVASYLPTVLAIRERPTLRHDVEGAPSALWPWLRTTLQHRAFLHLVAATSLCWFGLNLALMLVPFWVQDVLGLPEAAVAKLMAPFLISNILFFGVFNLLAKRFGKYRMFLVTLIGSGFALPLIALVGVFELGSPLILSMVAFGVVGAPVAGFLMLPFALLADVVDDDAKATGRRREAIFFGVQAIFQKTVIGASILVFGLLAENSGATALRTVAVVAGVACLLGAVAFVGYPLRSVDRR
ncbi:MAG: MFS transporter [Pseudomonadota bacterium]